MSADGTKDLAAVVARVRNIAANLHDIADSDGVHNSGWGGQVHRAAASLEIEAESLLAAVSRPAEARANELREAYIEGYDDAEGDPQNRDADRHEKAWLASVTYNRILAHPAPSGGEELTETQRVAIALMGDCWLARSLKTPEQFRDHYIEYGRQEVEAAAPRPEPGEPSEAMVEADIALNAVDIVLRSDAHAATFQTLGQYRSDLRRKVASLRAALAAREAS